MEGLNLLQVDHWKPLVRYGFTHPFFYLNAHTIVNTWIVLGIIILLVLPIKFILNSRNNSTTRFAIVSSLESFAQFTTQTLGMFSFGHFSFIASLFIFITLCNCLSLIPWLEEPTQDLNTTLALGTISFLYVQWHAIRAQGFFHYLKEYFQPFFIMFPLHVIGKLATIISISFRLFGNIFGGATISHLYFALIKSSVFYEVLGLLMGMNMLVTFFFGFFEGLLQAFIFSMLTLTYLSIALHGEPTDEGIMT
jgi:F-type H+-transporting ATPase subunit a